MVTRRHLMKSTLAMSAGALGAAGLGAGVLAMGVPQAKVMAADGSFFGARKLPLGLQLYALEPLAKDDMQGTLNAVSAIGYESIELAGLYGNSAESVRGWLDDAGLISRSMHVPFIAYGGGFGLDDYGLNGNLDTLIKDAHTLGLEHIIVPMFLFPERAEQKAGQSFFEFLQSMTDYLTVDDWKHMADILNKKGKVFKEAGLQIGYHNHNQEFAPVNGTTGFEILLSETDPEIVNFEIDAAWVTAAGLNPVDVIKAHPGRFKLMHVKDVAAGTVPNYRLSLKPTEVGAGIIDWPSLLPAAYDAGIEHFFVEQEPPYPNGRITSVKESYRYLEHLKA